MKLASCEQMRQLDKTAIEQYKIPSVVLMENAAISIYNICKDLDAYKNKKVMIFCGTGNNGGDGFAIARHMKNDGATVSVVLVGTPEKISGDALINYDICVNLGIEIEIFKDSTQIHNKPSTYDLIIDAMLGTGVSGELKPPMSDAVSLINESGKYIIAVDCPTGGNPDNGKISGSCGDSGACVRADLTVTLGLSKPGLMLYPLADYTGNIEIGSIGAETVFEKFEANFLALDDRSAARLLPKRHARSHKGTFGKVAIVAGSRNMPGAAAYCANASYSMGCGYVNICAPKGIINTLQILAPQAITTSLPESGGFLAKASAAVAINLINKYTACLIGPGLGNNDETAALVKEIIRSAKVPLIIDADALNAIADEPEILKEAAFPPIITPHILEMSRLSKIPAPEISDDILKTAIDFSKKYNCITVLKDAATIIASNSGKTYINKGGVSALAKAGSGDVLAGIIAALVAQGANTSEAAALGTYIHTQSGKAAASKLGDYSVSADDIIEYIHIAIKKITGDR